MAKEEGSASAKDHGTELETLRARVKELEAKLSHRDTDSEKDPASRAADSVRDVTERGRSAKERLFRGFVHASVETVNGFADALSATTGAILDRNRGGSSDTTRKLNRRVATDVFSGLADSFDRFVDIPRRASERFTERYNDRKSDD